MVCENLQIYLLSFSFTSFSLLLLVCTSSFLLRLVYALHIWNLHEVWRFSSLHFWDYFYDYVSFRYTAQWFDIYIFYKTITTVSQVIVVTIQSQLFFLAVEALKIYSLDDFQIGNTILLITVTILYITSNDLFIL